MMNRFLLPATAALALLSACGGSSGASSKSGPAPDRPRVLVYTNPPARGFRLEVDPATNRSGRLVLHLVGPAGQRARGVAFHLHADPDRLSWGQPGSGSGWLRPGDVWRPGEAEPRLCRAKVADGTLQAGLFHRDGDAPVLGSAPLAAIALDLKPGAAPGPVALTQPEGRPPVFLDGDRELRPLALGVGTLHVQ
jgi:hypothetical protein